MRKHKVLVVTTAGVWGQVAQSRYDPELIQLLNGYLSLHPTPRWVDRKGDKGTSPSKDVDEKRAVWNMK